MGFVSRLGLHLDFGGALGLLLWVGFSVLVLATWVKILTKAGYSGWWMLVP